MKESILSISEAARQLHVETHVLRYWEDELDIPVPRNEMGHRLYGAHEMKLFHTVRELKQYGFQLRAIKWLLHSVKAGGELDMERLISMRDEINQKAEYLNEEQKEGMDPLAEFMEESLQKRPSVNEGNGNIRHLQVVSKNKSLNRIRTDKEEIPETKHNGITKERMQQFQYIMLNIMGEAFQENNEKIVTEVKSALLKQLSDTFAKALGNQIVEQMNGKMANSISEQVAVNLEQTLGDHISDDISIRVIKEMNYIARMQEEKEEEHYKKLDETLRLVQTGKKKTKPSRKLLRRMKKEEKLVAASKEK